MQQKINFNTEKHAQLHMNRYDVCPKCGEHSLVRPTKTETHHCKNSFCGYRPTTRANSRKRWNVA